MKMGISIAFISTSQMEYIRVSPLEQQLLFADMKKPNFQVRLLGWDHLRLDEYAAQRNPLLWSQVSSNVIFLIPYLQNSLASVVEISLSGELLW